MRTRSTLRSIGLFVFPAILAGVGPSSIGPHGPEVAVAACQDGTCCPEEGSTCVVGTIARPNKYYKSSGSCKGATEPAPPP